MGHSHNRNIFKIYSVDSCNSGRRKIDRREYGQNVQPSVGCLVGLGKLELIETIDTALQPFDRLEPSVQIQPGLKKDVFLSIHQLKKIATGT